VLVGYVEQLGKEIERTHTKAALQLLYNMFLLSCDFDGAIIRALRFVVANFLYLEEGAHREGLKFRELITDSTSAGLVKYLGDTLRTAPGEILTINVLAFALHVTICVERFVDNCWTEESYRPDPNRGRAQPPAPLWAELTLNICISFKYAHYDILYRALNNVLYFYDTEVMVFPLEKSL